MKILKKQKLVENMIYGYELCGNFWQGFCSTGDGCRLNFDPDDGCQFCDWGEEQGTLGTSCD